MVRRGGRSVTCPSRCHGLEGGLRVAVGEGETILVGVRVGEGNVIVGLGIAVSVDVGGWVAVNVGVMVVVAVGDGLIARVGVF